MRRPMGDRSRRALEMLAARSITVAQTDRVHDAVETAGAE